MCKQNIKIVRALMKKNDCTVLASVGHPLQPGFELYLKKITFCKFCPPFFILLFYH